MIRTLKGNILSSTTHAIVIPVNCVGVMGAGLAKQFKQKYPEVFVTYYKACMRGALSEGDCFTVNHNDKGKSVLFILAATKNHWRDDSNLDKVKNCIVRIKEIVENNHIPSVSIPALGAGLGKLEWSDVEKALHDTFSPYKEMSTKIVDIYSPI
jgi:O-acetyl-ADP-ribose deacetylase (regulator of RNase III)